MPGAIEEGVETAEVCLHIDIPCLAHIQVRFPYPGLVAGTVWVIAKPVLDSAEE